MTLKNSSTQFGSISIALHWIIALLMIGMLCVGLYMVGLPLSPQKIQIYGWHKATGMFILLMVLLRLIWRLSNIQPRLKLPFWEKISARVMHWLLYALMFLMPLTGWLMTSAAGYTVSFFGLFIIPAPISANEQAKALFGTLHEGFAYALIVAIIIHILAALKHHFIDKDDILRRML